jgi:lysylphosphatidylglycerol synthetase-like protein (DUF2156 family)
MISSIERRTRLVLEHGSDPIAYSTLQRGLRYFETDKGYIAYHSAWGVHITLGPPVCAPQDRSELALRFLRAKPRVVFFYIPLDFAQLLSDVDERRTFCAGLGVDKVIPVGAPLDSAKEVRGSLKKARASGFTIERANLGGLSAEERARLADINERYLAGRRQTEEMKFLNRPMEFEDDGLARVYLLRWREGDSEKVHGYARLNPYFVGGKLAGYLLDVLRFESTRLWGVFYSAVALIAADLEPGGVRELSLGFCPLFHAETAPSLPRSRDLEGQIGWMAQHLGEVPYVERLHAQKSVFPGEERQRYMASRLGSAVRPFLAMLSASGVSIGSLIGRNLVKSLTAPYRRVEAGG